MGRGLSFANCISRFLGQLPAEFSQWEAPVGDGRLEEGSGPHVLLLRGLSFRISCSGCVFVIAPVPTEQPRHSPSFRQVTSAPGLGSYLFLPLSLRARVAVMTSCWYESLGFLINPLWFLKCFITWVNNSPY